MTPLRAEDIEAVTFLQEQGAHFVLLHNAPGTDRHKVPLWYKYQLPRNRPSLRQCLAHLEAGGLLGHISASLGLAVVDVDEADPDGLFDWMSRYRPLGDVPSQQAGRVHLYYDARGRMGQQERADAAALRHEGGHPLPGDGGHLGPVRRRGDRCPAGDGSETGTFPAEDGPGADGAAETAGMGRNAASGTGDPASTPTDRDGSLGSLPVAVPDARGRAPADSGRRAQHGPVRCGEEVRVPSAPGEAAGTMCVGAGMPSGWALPSRPTGCSPSPWGSGRCPKRRPRYPAGPGRTRSSEGVGMTAAGTRRSSPGGGC